MARSDWWYVNLPKEQQDAIKLILKREGRKYGIMDESSLVRTVVGDLIARYEEKNGLIAARKAVRAPYDKDVPQPMDR